MSKYTSLKASTNSLNEKDNFTCKLEVAIDTHQHVLKNELIFNYDTFKDLTKVLHNNYDIIVNMYNSDTNESCNKLQSLFKDRLKDKFKDYLSILGVRIVLVNENSLIFQNLKSHIKVQQDLNYLKSETVCFPYNFLNVKREPIFTTENHIMKFSFEEIPVNASSITNVEEESKRINIFFIFLDALYLAYKEKRYVGFDINQTNVIVRNHGEHKFFLFDNDMLCISDVSPFILDLSSAKPSKSIFNSHKGFDNLKLNIQQSSELIGFTSQLNTYTLALDKHNKSFDDIKTLDELKIFMIEFYNNLNKLEL
jgi:hypothetical protein